jgi:hypothetical protein
VAHAGNDLRPILFDRLAGAPTIASLAPSQIDGQRVGRKGKARRYPLEGDAERWPV